MDDKNIADLTRNHGIDFAKTGEISPKEFVALMQDMYEGRFVGDLIVDGPNAPFPEMLEKQLASRDKGAESMWYARMEASPNTPFNYTIVNNGITWGGPHEVLSFTGNLTEGVVTANLYNRPNYDTQFHIFSKNDRDIFIAQREKGVAQPHERTASLYIPPDSKIFHFAYRRRPVD